MSGSLVVEQVLGRRTTIDWQQPVPRRYDIGITDYVDSLAFQECAP